MRSSWKPSEDELDEYARGPVTYEMEMVIEQLRALNGTPGRWPNPVSNALIEAFLVHIRLLDDFVGNPRQSEQERKGDLDDVFARHWLPTWQPSRFLTGEQIRNINAQLSHLAARRQHWRFPWDLDELALACAMKLEEFCTALESSDPRRAKAFARLRSSYATIAS